LKKNGKASKSFSSSYHSTRALDGSKREKKNRHLKAETIELREYDCQEKQTKRRTETA